MIVRVNLFSKRINPFHRSTRSCPGPVIEVDKGITSVGKAEMRSMTSRNASRNALTC